MTIDNTDSGNVNTDKEYIWKQFEKIVELHSFYFENLIKAASFSFGIIGVILTYLVKLKIDSGIENGEDLFKSILQVPFILSIATSAIFAIGTWKTWQFSRWVIDFKDKHNFEWRPHAEALAYMSFAFFCAFFDCFIRYWKNNL